MGLNNWSMAKISNESFIKQFINRLLIDYQSITNRLPVIFQNILKIKYLQSIITFKNIKM